MNKLAQKFYTAASNIVDTLHFWMEEDIYNTLGMFRTMKWFFLIPITISFVITVAAAVASYFVVESVGTSILFTIFALAVFASAWLAGFAGGMTSVFVSLFYMSAAIAGGPYKIPLDTASVINLILFFIGGSVVSFLVATLARVRFSVTEIVNNINDGFVATDKADRIQYVNKRMESILGKKKLQLFGQKVWREFPESLQGIIREKIEQSEEVGVVEFEIYYALLRIWFLVRVYRSKHGGVSAYLTDITERKNRELTKDDFVSVASHELKTPVTSVKLFGQILEDRLKKSSDSESHDLISKLNRQLDRLVELILSLLDVTKIQQGKLQLEKEKFDLKMLVREAVEDIRGAASRHKIEITDEDEVSVEADKKRIRQVLTNFLVNAVKYSPEADRVLVSVKNKDGNAVVSVKDFGIGISKEKQNLIFDRFFQVNGSAPSYAGLGLGLYISKEIVDMHKGRLWVESDEGRGSTFYFSLPL